MISFEICMVQLSVGFRRGSRVDGILSRVEGKISRVEGSFLIVFFELWSQDFPIFRTSKKHSLRILYQFSCRYPMLLIQSP